MADNYLPMYDAPNDTKLEMLYRRYEKKLKTIISHIRVRDRVIAPSVGWILYTRYPRSISHVSDMAAHFTADKSCNGCGQCQRVCPVNNIVIADSRPVWQHRCEFCLACIHLCPQQAIQWKNVTQKKGRYHFKDITPSDIMKQKPR